MNQDAIDERGSIHLGQLSFHLRGSSWSRQSKDWQVISNCGMAVYSSGTGRDLAGQCTL